jgi:hypothetical protein
MTDDLSKRGSQDRNRINVNEKHELRRWAQKFGCTEDELREAVKQAGPMASSASSSAPDTARAGPPRGGPVAAVVGCERQDLNLLCPDHATAGDNSRMGRSASGARGLRWHSSRRFVTGSDDRFQAAPTPHGNSMPTE